MEAKIKALIEHFHFSTLPAEGTLFASTWRSTQEFADGSPVGTAMIGMYCSDPLSQSFFHRLPVDETWHFYGGDAIRLVLLTPDGGSFEVIMGSDPLKKEHVQFVVPAGFWQAGELVEGGSYALFGCAPWHPDSPAACMRVVSAKNCWLTIQIEEETFYY